MKLSPQYVVLAGLLGLFGCAPTPPPYPTTPPTMKPAATVPTDMPTAPTTAPVLMKVPADAQVLSSGDYPPPAFDAPNAPGLIAVVDLDGDPTVAIASTSVTGTGGPSKMSITDILNMSGNFNKLHKYKVVFVPAKKPGM